MSRAESVQIVGPGALSGPVSAGRAAVVFPEEADEVVRVRVAALFSDLGDGKTAAEQEPARIGEPELPDVSGRALPGVTAEQSIEITGA